MADNVIVAGELAAGIGATTIPVSTDEIVGPPVRHVQRMKLAYSADGVETHVQADIEGLLVNSNPKVAVASNTGSQVSIPTTPGGTVLLAANANRNGYGFYLEADAFISWGGTPTSSSWKQLAFTPFNMFTGVIYTGEIRALSAAGTIIGHVMEV